MNITHFKIHAGIFIQMTGGVVFFRAEYRTDLEDAFVYPHHHLFVKLRTLCQAGFCVKIVEPEDIGAAFRSLGYQFGRMDFREVTSL